MWIQYYHEISIRVNYNSYMFAVLNGQICDWFLTDAFVLWIQKNSNQQKLKAKTTCSSQLEPIAASQAGKGEEGGGTGECAWVLIILALSRQWWFIKKRPVGKNIASFTERIPNWYKSTLGTDLNKFRFPR